MPRHGPRPLLPLLNVSAFEYFIKIKMYRSRVFSGDPEIQIEKLVKTQKQTFYLTAKIEIEENH